MAMNGFHGDQVTEHHNGDDVITDDSFLHLKEVSKTSGFDDQSPEQTPVQTPDQIQEKNVNDETSLSDEITLHVTSDVNGGSWCSTNDDAVDNHADVISADSQPKQTSASCADDLHDDQLTSSNNGDVAYENDVTKSHELPKEESNIEPEINQVDATCGEPEMKEEENSMDVSSTTDTGNKVDENAQSLACIQNSSDVMIQEQILASLSEDCLSNGHSTVESPLFDGNKEYKTTSQLVGEADSESTAATPKDEYRHLLCHEQHKTVVADQVQTEHFVVSTTTLEETRVVETERDVTTVTSSNDIALVTCSTTNESSSFESVYDVTKSSISSVVTDYDTLTRDVPLSTNTVDDKEYHIDHSTQSQTCNGAEQVTKVEESEAQASTPDLVATSPLPVTSYSESASQRLSTSFEDSNSSLNHEITVIKDKEVINQESKHQTCNGPQQVIKVEESEPQTSTPDLVATSPLPVTSYTESASQRLSTSFEDSNSSLNHEITVIKDKEVINQESKHQTCNGPQQVTKVEESEPQTSTPDLVATSPLPVTSDSESASQRLSTSFEDSNSSLNHEITVIKEQEKKQQRPLSLNLKSAETKPSPASSSAAELSTTPRKDLEIVSPSSIVVNRLPVEKVAPPEITKTVCRMFESGEIADRHQVPRRTMRIDDEIASESSGVYENQPTAIDNDVIRDTGEYISPRSEVQEGLTKSLLSQWQAKGNQEFRSERRPIIVAEAEGVVLESQPCPQRPDVVREDCRDPAADLPTPGYARLLRERFTEQKEHQTCPKKDAKAAVLAEMAAAAESGAPSVIENVPNRRPDDILREDDTVEEVWLRKGYTRDLTGFWSSPQQPQGSSPRAPIELPRSENNGQSVYENSPRTLDETVVRSGECHEEQIGVEKGRAKTMVGMWQNRAGDTPVKPRAEPISLEKESDQQGASVYENEPTQRQGVVRSGDQIEEVMGKQGLIRNISERFTGPQHCNGTGVVRGPVPDMVAIDRADGPAVLENEPTQLGPDVIRSLQPGCEETNVEPGSTRNLVACWKNKELESNSPQVSRQLELDLARDAGVYENQPEVRTDVVRADYDEPEMISVAQMRSTRALWNQKELEEQRQSDRGTRSSKKSPPQPVRFTPPRERTPPRVAQEDFRSYQSITLSSSKSNTPGRLSPSNTQRQQHQPLPDPVSMTSSTVLVFK